MEDSSPNSKRAELRKAVYDLRDRGLYAAAKWAAEQAAGLAVEGERPSRPSRKSRMGHHAASDDEEDDDAFLLAKSCFDMKEYMRAVHILRKHMAGKALFLRCYAVYLAGEKRKEESRIETGGPFSQAPMNTELQALEAELQAVRSAGRADGFHLYILGLVLSDSGKREEAREVLLESVTLYPCNWSAWLALGHVIDASASEAELDVPKHWMRYFFLAHLCVDGYDSTEALERLKVVMSGFPFSDWGLMALATAHYNLRHFDESEELFETLLSRDPHRIEGVDTYSNILYVKEQVAALSHLAHRCVLTDKYTPQTCCIIGNYYSLKAQHEKAVLYFRRSLRMDRNYLAAWTLMGHEFIEMKNPAAAVEAYRSAVEINQKDYRAWYGLGQAYELLGLPYYALHYFRRATQLRLADARMWVAMGQCYEHDNLSMDEAAKRCYRHALLLGDREGIALHKLAKIHERMGERDEAARFYLSNLARIQTEGLNGQDAVDALLFLTRYKMDNNCLEEAEEFAKQLLDYGGPSKEKAQALLREMQALFSRRHPGRMMSTPVGPPGMRPLGFSSLVPRGAETPEMMSPSSDIDFSPL